MQAGFYMSKRSTLIRELIGIAVVASSLTQSSMHVSAQTQPNGSFDGAVKLYEQHQYKQALPLFMQYLKANPRSPVAYLYIANSYYGLQQVAPAKQTYQMLIQYFPYSSEAVSAKAFLSRLQPGPQTKAGDHETSQTDVNSVPVSRARKGTRITGDDAGSEIAMRIVRPLQDHPSVSEDLISAVRNRLDNYPKSVKRLLAQNKVAVVVTPTLIDNNPELKNQEARGYDGHSYKLCPGMFDGRSIFLCEHTLDETTEVVHDAFPVSQVLIVLNHECGHAIDSSLGLLSEKEEFKHIYLLHSASAQRKDASVSRELAYYLQKSDAGQSECFAELVGIILGTQNDTSEKMRSAFPQTLKFLKAKLGV